jgi:spermidine/putrescine transport system permease protein
LFRRRILKANKKQAMTWPAMLVLLCFTVFPLLIMFETSFRSDTTGAFTLENYQKFFSNLMYLKLTGSTLLMSLLVTVISLVIAYPLSYIMAKKLKGLKNVILVLTIIPFFTNQLVRVYSWLIFLQDGGILNRLFMAFGLAENGLGILYTRAAVVIGLTHAFFPYMVVTIYMALERMDDSLIEASMSLGASKWTTFKDVIFPISMPGVMSGVTIVFVPCLGSFVEPRILGGVNGTVIGTVIEDQFFQLYGWNFGAAIAFVLFAMVLIFMGAFGALGRRWETE